MSSSHPRARRVRRVAVAVACGVLLAFLPAPTFTFIDASVGGLSPFPTVTDVAASELQDMQESVDTVLTGDRVVGTEADAGDFTMIGVTLEEEPTEPVMVRLLEDDGSWGEWNELEYEDEHGPDPGTGESNNIATEPLWVGSATGYQLSVADGDESGAEVALVREEPMRVVADSTPLADAVSSPAPFSITPRSSWNVRSTSTSVAASLTRAVVHHTASSNAYTRAQVPSILRSIQAYHMDARGWSDIGYNFLVDRFGGIWEGRGGGMGRPVIGAHAAGVNTGSVGVSVIGNFTGVSAPSAVNEAVARVIGWRLEAYGVDPRTNVVGHRDVGSTSCPGTIHGSLPWIRTRARAWYDTTAARQNPVGRVDGITAGTGVITTAGWAFDPDTSSPIQVTLIARGQWHTTTANRARSDWEYHYATYGNDHGFAIGIEVPPGAYSTCVVALNARDGRDSFLSCADVVVK